jgi:hypothetical protein
MSLNAVCTLSAHCAGLDTNNLIFWTYWSTHGFYTKRSPPRGTLVFHVVRDCVFFVFGTGTGLGDSRRIRSALFDHPVDPRGVYKGVKGNGAELGKERESEAWLLIIALRSLVILKKSIFRWIERIGCTSMIIIHPKKEAGQVRTKIASSPSSFASGYSFLSVLFVGYSMGFATIAVP